MPPRKPRTTEPVPSTRIPTSTKISRTSLPNLPPSSPSKPSNKKRTVIKDADEVIEEVEEEVEKQKPAAKVRAGPAKKKVKVDIVEEGDQVMISVEGKKTGIPAPKAKSAAAATKGKQSAPARTKNTRRESSKGEDKIGQIYAVGHELLSDTSVETRAATINTTLDKLEKQLHIPPDRLKRLCSERAELYRKMNHLAQPVQDLLTSHSELRDSLIVIAGTYEKLPLDAKDILADIGKAHKGAVESGMRYIEESQDYTAFIRGARRFIDWK